MPGVDMSTYPSGVKSDQSRAESNTYREQYLACIFISGACNVRDGAMNRDFQNEYLKDKDAHPNTFEAALNYMNDYQNLNKHGRYKKPHRKNEEQRLVFAQNGGGNTTGQK